MTSAEGKLVYNKTIIYTAPANVSNYVWTIDQYKKDTKILVNAADEYGCLGRDGFFLVNKTKTNSFLKKSVFVRMLDYKKNIKNYHTFLINILL